MREIFSVRFFAAVGAVVGLFFLLTTIFATREVIEGDGTADDGPPVTHRVDLVDHVASSSDPRFRVVDGVAVGDTRLALDDARAMRIVDGTPGTDHCGQLRRSGACAVVADLLGEGVVWFALVPAEPGRSVELPAIDVLDGGLAHLVNGWQLPYAPVLDRRCETEFDSYRDFRDALGDDFTSIYDLDERRLTAVVCERRVPYAPTTTVPDDEPASPLDTTSTSAPQP